MGLSKTKAHPKFVLIKKNFYEKAHKKETPKKDNQYKKLDMRPEICGDYFKMISFT